MSSTRRFNCRQAGDLIVADQSALERKKNALFADNRVFQIEMEELVNPFERIPTPGSFLTDLIGFDPISLNFHRGSHKPVLRPQCKLLKAFFKC